MILASHQPDFAPYPGFWYKLYKADVFVLSDDVAYSNSEMHKYNFIRCGSDRQRIGIPVCAHSDGTTLRNVQVADDDRLIFKAVRTFEQAYSKAPYFEEYGEPFMNILISATTWKPVRLCQINQAIIFWMLDGFGWKTDVVFASSLMPRGRRDERIIDLCRSMRCDEYLSGWGAAAYHQPDLFDQNDIRLTYTDYKTLEYKQFQGGFVKDCSMIDYIMNHGFETPKEWGD